MSNDKNIEFFNKNGYLIIPNVLSLSTVETLRSKILDIFSTGGWKSSEFNTEKVLSDVYNVFPEFIEMTLTEDVLNSVKTILGPHPILMPETAVHYKFYTGWHKDTTSQEKMGYQFHHKPESLMIECGFYLQDNDEYGGGLTVMEGSHRTEDVYTKPPSQKSVVSRISNKLFGSADPLGDSINPNQHPIVDIKSKAGDMVIFNFKTNHRATMPQKVKVEEIPDQFSKIAFFNAFSVNNETANDYLNYIKSRPEPFYQNLKNRILNDQLVKKAKQLDFTVI